MLGAMIDCSRNAVMTVKAVKEFVNLMEKMGYDTLMLYTEDTYEVNNEPYFGFLRGRYSKAELKELDAYCLAHGIELIPCIQTLAHVNGIFQASDVYQPIRDCDDILLIGHQRTQILLENIFATLAECFTSRKVHIGMDEADKVGLGKYLKAHGLCDRFDLINGHLHRVCQIAGRYGFRPMFWSDMFCRLAANDGNYYDGVDLDAIRRRADLPQSVSLVYWDYYSDDYDRYVRMVRTNQAFDRPVVFAGGAWTWKGFAPDNGYSIQNTLPALRACADTGVEDVFFTVWGDDGGECSRFSVLPALLYGAEVKRGNADMASIREKFTALTGMNMEDFFLLDALNQPGGKHEHSPAKYLLYNDPLMGLHDHRVSPGDGAYYAGLARKLRAVKPAAPFRRIFASAIALCDVLEIKAELGVRTRAAYQAKDPEALRALATVTYPAVMEKLECFYRAYAAQWTAENKPQGFDVQDIRIGTLMWRLKQSARRLLDCANGDLEEIPELEEELLEGTGQILWARTVTPNVISHPCF